MGLIYKLKDIPHEKRPREKISREGIDSLSNSELISLIIGSGNRKESVTEISDKIIDPITSRFLSSEKDPSKLQASFSISYINACKIAAVFELGRRYLVQDEEENIFINSPRDVFSLLNNIKTKQKEELHGLYLNTQNRIIYHEILSIGSVDRSLIHPREVIYPAIKYKACSIIIAHNHPSHDHTPSDDDIKETQKLYKACRIVSIELLDHIIIGKFGYTSLKEIGII